MKKTKREYVMTLVWEDKTETFNFYSSEDIKDGQKDDFLEMIMIDYLEENGYDTKDNLPIDYVVDTYDNWCFMQSLYEQIEERDMFLANYEENMFGTL